MIGDGCMPAADDALVPRLVLLHRRRPRDVVHRSGAAEAALGRRLVVGVETAARGAARLPGVVARGDEPERLLEERTARVGRGGVRANGVEPLERVLGRNLGMLGEERRVVDGGRRRAGGGAPRDPSNVTPTSSRVDGVGLRGEPALPEVERSVRADAPLHGVHHPRARAPAPDARVLEERDVAAGRPVLVGVEEVVDGRVVLVDRLLHEPEAENACVEVDVPRRVAP